MGCALVSALFGLPRVAWVFVWFTQPGYITRAFDGQTLFTLLGFVFLPLTSLAFAFGSNSLGAPGELTAFGWGLTAVGFAIDVGLVSRTRGSRDK